MALVEYSSGSDDDVPHSEEPRRFAVVPPTSAREIDDRGKVRRFEHVEGDFHVALFIECKNKLTQPLACDRLI